MTYTFSFSPGPHLRPITRRSITGPLSRSKLHTTISLIHLPMRSAKVGLTSGGGLGSPGRLDHPSRFDGVTSVAEKGSCVCSSGWVD